MSPRDLRRHLPAVLLILVVAAPAADAMALCAGLAGGANHRLCCIGHGHSATPREARECCAMAEQPEAQGPIEARPDVTTPALSAHIEALPAVTLPAASSMTRPRELLVHRGLPSVPIYLQHLTLLI